MIKRYQTNLRCAGCVATLTPQMMGLTWSVDVDSPLKVLTVDGDEAVQASIPARMTAAGYAILKELPPVVSLGMVPMPSVAPELPAADRKTYFPLILILFYLLAGTTGLEIASSQFDAMRAMRHFMAGFFLVFSFFKLLNLSAFADAYSGYDIIAQRIRVYGFVYPFIELALGFAYLANGNMRIVNPVTLVVMAVSLVGVLRTVLAKRQIRCACLGTVFNLPMSYVTIIEDGLMIAMSGAMIMLSI